MKTIIFVILCLFCLNPSFSQKNNYSHSLDSIKQAQANLPLEKRVRITVLDFTTLDGTDHNLNDILTMLLTDALQEANCYRVLENVHSTYETNNEVYTGGNAAYSAQTGKQLGAQVIIKGQVVGLTVSEKKLFSLKSPKIQLSLIVKVTNPETRDIMFSKDFSAADDEVSTLGAGGHFVTNIYAIENNMVKVKLCKELVVQIVEFLISKKDQLQLSDPNNTQANPAGSTETVVTLYNANFALFNAMASILNTAPSYKSMERRFTNNIATYTVVSVGSSDVLLNEISQKAGDKYEVIGFEHGKISLTSK